MHVAGAHLRGRSGRYNTGPASELLPAGGEVIGFSAWQEGLVLRPEAADGIDGVADVVRRGASDAQSIRDTLAATKNFSGVTGSVEFDGHNQNTRMDTVHYMETLPDLSWKALSWN